MAWWLTRRFSQIFVVSNQGGEDETRIDAIDIYGVPVMYVPSHTRYSSQSMTECLFVLRGTRDVSGLKKVEDE